MIQERCIQSRRKDDIGYIVPKPTPFVPDVKTFLSLIGRDLAKEEEKIPSWEALFTLSSDQLKELGVEPARTRKYLLNWRHKFRNGVYGIGGDLKYVENGTAELRILETPNTLNAANPPRRIVVNVPKGKQPTDLPTSELVRPKGFKVRNGNTIAGKHALPLRWDLGGGAKVSVTEGMWEFKRGRKIDGGERRRAEVRFLRRVSQRKESRGS